MGGCTDEPRTMDFPAAPASEPAPVTAARVRRPALCRPLRLSPPCWWPAPLRWPRSFRRPTGEWLKDSRHTRGHVSGRRQDRTGTEKPVRTIFQNRCWVCGPGVEFTGKGGEEPLSGEKGQAPPRNANKGEHQWAGCSEGLILGTRDPAGVARLTGEYDASDPTLRRWKGAF